jgi:hypothetical protein
MIALVHLVWGPLGLSPLRRFIASYNAHPAGVDHELVVVLNGLGEHGSSPPTLEQDLRAELERVPHREIVLPRAVLDLDAYLQTARQLEHDRLCFLNSHSEILASGWLAKLDCALDEPAAGIAGASGSWVSNRSLVLHSLGLPSAYRGVLPGRRIAREQFAAMRAAHPSEPEGRRQLGRVRAFLANLPQLPAQFVGFDPFPAHHLRTNAFIVPRRVLEGLRIGSLATKIDTYRLESGSSGITSQVLSQGLRALVVDRDGACYEPEHWDRSGTLWQADQEGLLVADNQTRLYSTGEADRRRLLSALAWGARAAPDLPQGTP